MTVTGLQPVTVFAAEEYAPAGTAVVQAAGGIKIHMHPSSSSEEIGNIRNNKEFSYFAVCGGWLLVNCADEQGYVSKSLCRPVSDTPSETPNYERYSDEDRYCVIPEAIKVRTGPGSFYEHCGYLRQNDVVVLVGECGGWAEIWYTDQGENMLCWCSKDGLIPTDKPAGHDLPSRKDRDVISLVIKQDPEDAVYEIAPKSSVSFHAEAESSFGELTYEWFTDIPFSTLVSYDYAEISGEYTDTLTLSAVSSKINGMKVWCRISNGLKTEETKKAVLKVEEQKPESSEITAVTVNLPPTFLLDDIGSAVGIPSSQYRKFQVLNADWTADNTLEMIMAPKKGYEFSGSLTAEDISFTGSSVKLESAAVNEDGTLSLIFKPVPSKGQPSVDNLSMGMGDQTIQIRESERPRGVRLSCANRTQQTATYTLLQGTLPEGIDINTNGQISGTPAEGSAGIYYLTVTANTSRGTARFEYDTGEKDENGNPIKAYREVMLSQQTANAKVTLIVTPAHIHQYEETLTEADCGHDALRIMTCSCGKTYEVVLEDAPDHVWDDWTVLRNACKETGEISRKCINCQEEETLLVPEAGHTDHDYDDICDNCGTIMGADQFDNECIYFDDGTAETGRRVGWISRNQGLLIASAIGFAVAVVTFFVMFLIRKKRGDTWDTEIDEEDTADTDKADADTAESDELVDSIKIEIRDHENTEENK